MLQSNRPLTHAVYSVISPNHHHSDGLEAVVKHSEQDPGAEGSCWPGPHGRLQHSAHPPVLATSSTVLSPSPCHNPAGTCSSPLNVLPPSRQDRPDCQEPHTLRSRAPLVEGNFELPHSSSLAFCVGGSEQFNVLPFGTDFSLLNRHMCRDSKAKPP